MSWLKFGRKAPTPLTSTERFIQREFPEAIALAARDWKGFEAHFSHVDPTWPDNPLRRRLVAFMFGPIFADLEKCFPEIVAKGADIDAETGLGGHKDVILHNIVFEGVVASGSNDREEVKSATEGLI
jgi:hypothetical protein